MPLVRIFLFIAVRFRLYIISCESLQSMGQFLEVKTGLLETSEISKIPSQTI
jgi:hypothetical protein